MTTRVRYSREQAGRINSFVSEYYLVGSTQVRIRITPHPNMVYWIEDSEGDILHSGYSNSIRMAKVNAKMMLKKLGVIFEEEMRK